MKMKAVETIYLDDPEEMEAVSDSDEGMVVVEEIELPESDSQTYDEDSNSLLEDVGAYGQIAAEAASFGLLGDEVAALGRTGVDYLIENFLDEEESDVSFGDRYEMYLAEARNIEENFREEHTGLSVGTDIALGLAGGFKVAGAIPNAAKRMGNVARQGAAAGVETAVRMGMEGEGLEDRAKKAGMGLGIGTVLGGAGGALMRGSDDIAARAAKAQKVKAKYAKADDSERSLAGKEGWVDPDTRVKESTGVRGMFNNVANSLKTTAAKTVSPRFGMLMNRADGAKMREVAEIVAYVDGPKKGLRQLDKFFHSGSEEANFVAKLIHNANARVGPKGMELTEAHREAMLRMAQAELKKVSPDLAETFGRMRHHVQLMSRNDIVQEATNGYFPRRVSGKAIDRARAKRDRKEGPRSRLTKAFQKTSSAVDSERPWVTSKNMGNYRAPTAAFMDYIEEASTIKSVVQTFHLDDILYPGAAKLTSKADGEAFESSFKALANGLNQRMKEQGAKKATRRQAENLMESFVESSRRGPNEVLQGLRTATSVALLGTPENAALQFGDQGVAAYRYGLLNAIMALPKSFRSMIFTHTDHMTKGDILGKGAYNKHFRAPDVGITKQFLGEMKREGDHPVTKVLDVMGDKIMGAMGVRRVNRMGQEVTMNAAWDRAKGLAKFKGGLEADLPGWTSQEIKALRNDLIDGEKSDLVASYVFSKLTDIQPVSSTALPKAYADHPNGRVWYAMKTYMVKQAEIMRQDIFGKFAQAEKLGLNTPQGKKLASEAAVNAGRYVAFVAALNGFVDEKRRVPRRGVDEYEPVASTTRQVVSNATGGIIDTKSSDYGRDVASGMIPPAYQAVGDVAGAVFVDVDPEALEKAVTRYLPPLRQAKWFKDLIGDEDDK
jgi:hypothetical protein